MSDSKILTLTDFGLHVGKHSERLIIKKGKDTIAEHPLLHLEQVVVAGRGISLSCDAIAECIERGITITLLDFSGKPYAKIVSPALTATVKTRREQLLAYYDERALQACLHFARGKMQNQINLVRYFAKYRKQVNPRLFTEVQERVAKISQLMDELDMLPATIAKHDSTLSVPSLTAGAQPGQSASSTEAVSASCRGTLELPLAGAEGQPVTVTETPIDRARPHLLNIEGRAAALYWECFQRLVPAGMFSRRDHRGAQDEVNALLNYG